MPEAPRNVRPNSVRILDRKALARVAKWIIKNKGSSWRAVEPLLHGLQPTLSRLQRQQLPSISPAVLNRLVLILQSRDQEKLARLVTEAVFTPQADRIFSAYSHWLERSLKVVHPGIDLSGSRFVM